MNKRIWLALWACLANGILAAESVSPVHLFVLSGQSNMAALEPEKSFLPELRRLLPGATIAHLKVAVGGEPIRFWLPEWGELATAAGVDPTNEKGPIYYEQILAQYRALAATHGAFASVTFCWMQGERDAKTGRAAAYEPALRRLIANVRRDLRREDLNVVIGRLSDHRPGEREQPGWDAVRGIHQRLAEQMPRTAWVDTDDLNNQTRKDGTRVDGLHYTSEGYATFGERLARQSVRLIRGVPPDNSGRPGPDVSPGAIARPKQSPVGEPHVYKRVGDRALRAFVLRPTAGEVPAPRPAIVFFHGGGWVGGEPSQFNEQALHFARRGLVCVQIEYRLLAPKSDDPPRVCIEDARSALRWVRARAAEFGIDPKRIAAAGGSAGGHLAAHVGLVEGVDDPADDLAISPKPAALLLFNPVLDNGPGEFGAARVRERLREYSPAHNVSRDDPPAVVFLGTADKLIPVGTMQRFANAMKAAGVRCDLHLYEGQPHGFFNYRAGDDRFFRETTRVADAFLVSLGWLPGIPAM